MISLFCLKEWRLDESGVDSARACSDNSLLIRSQSSGANEAQPFGKQLRLRRSGRRRQEQTDDGVELPGGIYSRTGFFPKIDASGNGAMVPTRHPDEASVRVWWEVTVLQDEALSALNSAGLGVQE